MLWRQARQAQRPLDPRNEQEARLLSGACRCILYVDIYNTYLDNLVHLGVHCALIEWLPPFKRII
jgi:hypothetical protein